jgi:hypothetical protein
MCVFLGLFCRFTRKIVHTKHRDTPLRLAHTNPNREELLPVALRVSSPKITQISNTTPTLRV